MSHPWRAPGMTSREALLFCLVGQVLLVLGLSSCCRADGPPRAPAPAYDPPPVRVAYRVRNTDPGTCLWNCFEMTGHVQGIEPLKGLTGRVMRARIGWPEGANDATMTYWLRTLGVPYEANPHGKTAAGRDWLAARVDNGRPVTAVIRVPGARDLHAVLLVDIDRARQEARLVDSNAPLHDRVLPFVAFHDAWTGAAVAFPAK